MRDEAEYSLFDVRKQQGLRQESLFDTPPLFLLMGWTEKLRSLFLIQDWRLEWLFNPSSR